MITTDEMTIIQSATAGNVLIRLYRAGQDAWGVDTTALRGRYVDRSMDAIEFTSEREARDHANALWESLRKPF